MRAHELCICGHVRTHADVELLLTATWTSSETRVVHPKSVTTTLGLLFNVISLASFLSSSCLEHDTMQFFLLISPLLYALINVTCTGMRLC